MPVQTSRFDAAEHLKTEEMRDEFLRAALETNDPSYIAHAVGVVARAYGMREVAKTTGKARQSLYRSLDQGGNPTIETLFGALDAMGKRLTLADR